MPLSDPYILWKVKPVSWDNSEARGGDRISPHCTLHFQDSRGTHKTDINVRSKDRVDHRLVFWTGELDKSTAYGIELINSLEALDKLQCYKNPVRLDYLHDDFISIHGGIIADTNVPGPGNDITDALDAFMNYQSPEFSNLTVYLWGEHYPGGIHQIHMNQGNFRRNPGWFAENGPGQDGGIVVKTPDRKWKYFFIAFAGQAAETDGHGNPATGDSTLMLRNVIS